MPFRGRAFIASAATRMTAGADLRVHPTELRPRSPREVVAPRPHEHHTTSARRSLVAGALLAALLSSLAVTAVTRLWDQPLHVPFEYAHVPTDDQQDATVDMMLVKDVHESGWLLRNPRLNAPFAQQWAEWPMGGDLIAYVVKKGLVDATGDVPLTLNL